MEVRAAEAAKQASVAIAEAEAARAENRRLEKMRQQAFDQRDEALMQLEATGGEETALELRFRRMEAEGQARFELRLEEEVGMRLSLEKADVAREVAAAEQPLQELLEMQRTDFAAALHTAQTELARGRAESVPTTVC